MSDINDRYKKAAALRLMTAMSGGPTQPAPTAPNYSAIPLDPPQPARYPGFGTGIANALETFGFGKPSAGAAQAPGGGQSVTVKATPPALPPFQGPGSSSAYMPPMNTPPAPKQSPSPFDVPFTGLRNDGGTGLPPYVQPGDVANAYMPPMGAQRPTPTAAPAPMPAAPQGADAAFVPPPGWMPPADYMRTMGDADLGGYGGNPGMGKPIPAPPQYTNLNPTPSLEEIFRREYAANPGAFGKIG